ncbi:unnamed protein product [Knipowitschia caucasica]|uniref:Uncharacterized protein n=1 Tax=Knipowitschia caucasica TaxID=637954 RepID=A0AAV2LCV2_KNICA
MSLKQILNGRPSIFSETPLEELIKTVKNALAMDYLEIRNVDFIIDVMVPEVTIDILMRLEGFTRFQAELTLGRIIDD